MLNNPSQETLSQHVSQMSIQAANNKKVMTLAASKSGLSGAI